MSLLEKISVIVPIYCVADCLDQCIESIVNQTYKNLEIILIDDGSMDQSGIICDQWAERDARIVVIHQENKGVSEARNRGLVLANGEYITFVDGDDWLEPHMYEHMMSGIQESSADAVYIGYQSVYPDGRVVLPKRLDSGCMDQQNAMMETLNGGYYVTIWNKLFKRSLCERNGGLVYFNKQYAWGEDALWLFTVLQNVETVFCVPEIGYNWRMRENSATRSSCFTTKILDVYRTNEEIYAIAAKTGSEIKQAAAVYQYISTFDIMTSAYLAGEMAICNDMKKKLDSYKKIWLRSNESTLGKVKKILVEGAISCKVPKKMVRKIYQTRR